MIGIFFRIGWWFQAAMLARLFHLRSNKALYISGDKLWNGSTYSGSAGSYFQVIRQFAFYFRTLWRKPMEFSRGERKSGAAVWDLDPKARDMRAEYLRRLGGIEVQLWLLGGKIVGGAGFAHRLLLSFLLLFLVFPWMLLVGISRKRRANAAQLPKALIQAFNAVLVLKKQGIRELYQFCIFEVSANFISYVCQRSGVRVVKIASESPLTFFNREIVGDELRLCTAYQEDEVAAFEETILAKKRKLWAPEQVFTYIDHYMSQSRPATRGVLGYYSSGAWRRKERGDPDPGFGFYESEQWLLERLSEYVKARPDLDFVIFPHPNERQTEELAARCAAFYADWFDLSRIRIYEGTERTSQAFEQADVAVSVFSAVMYDRLFCGYKSVLAPFSISEFPLKGSGLHRISAMDKEGLFALLDEAIKLETEAWFEEKGLEKYVFRNHPHEAFHISG